MQRVVVYLGHPAHFHLFKDFIKVLNEGDDEVLVIIKKKDILEKLLEAENIDYVNILSEGKGNYGKVSLGWSLLKRYYRMCKLLRQFRPDLMFGTSAEIAHLGKVFNVPSYIFEEDDWDVIPLFSRSVYPFATKVVVPVGCRMGKWEHKTIRHHSYHELAYLHPDHFTPSKALIKSFHDSNRPYFILRLVELSAFHDGGCSGISNEKALKLISLLEKHGDVYITTERKLSRSLDKYRISISPENMHHALSFAKMFIGDSQTMAAEAMVLGTPSIRCNNFSGRLSYLEELEKNYQLGDGFKPDQFSSLLKKVNILLESDELDKQWKKKRDRMISEKVNLANFMIDFAKNLSPLDEVKKRASDVILQKRVLDPNYWVKGV